MMIGTKLLAAILMLSALGQSETCVLQSYASSWMQTGTPFSVVCPSGTYDGDLVMTPARRFFRRGHLMLRFNQRKMVVVSNGKEGDLPPVAASRFRV